MRKIKPIIKTNYLQSIYNVDNLSKTIDKLVRKVRLLQKKYSFDAIAFSGTSGAAAAYTLSYKLKIPLICVRKYRDTSHFGGLVEGCISATKYIIVDDFIASGRTMTRIVNTINNEAKGRFNRSNKVDSRQVKPIAICLYDDENEYPDWKGIPIIRINY